MALLKEYSMNSLSSYITGSSVGAMIVRREDLHFEDAKSDKVYIGIVYKTGTDSHYYVSCLWGRRLSALNESPVGAYHSLYGAYEALNKQMKIKKAKGYKSVGVWNEGNKEPLIRGVLDAIKERFPIGAVVESPSGNMGVIVACDEHGTLRVNIGGKVVEVEFEKIGHLKVVGNPSEGVKLI